MGILYLCNFIVFFRRVDQREKTMKQ